MTANDNRLKKATIVHKGLPMASAPNKDAFLEFAVQQGWSVKPSAYKGKPLGYMGPGEQ